MRAHANDPADAAARVELIRIARSLRSCGSRVLGLWPASADVPVPPLALRLAAVLYELGREPTAVVDANPRWPAVDIDGIAAGPGAPEVLLRRISDGVALLAPRRPARTADGAALLRSLVASNRELFAYLLIDLSGYDQSGDHLAALEVTDAVMLVGRAGVTKERELLDLHAELPRAKSLGIILVG